MRVLIVAVCLCLCACDPGVSFSKSDLVGVYVADYHGNTARLTLQDDHSYTHSVALNGGHTEQRELWKRWQVTSEGATRTVVEFNDFRVIPAFTEVKKRGWATEVERNLFGHITLCFDSDNIAMSSNHDNQPRCAAHHKEGIA